MEKKDSNNKKILYTILFIIDISLIIFLFIVSIIMLVTMPDKIDPTQPATGFIDYLQKNSGVYLGCFVIPLFVLLVVNVIWLIYYVKKNSEKKKVELHDLSSEEKEKLKQELLKDLSSKDNEENKK
ncbi:MAG: hypothetical protein WCR97_05060 [Bacilli bacterium]